ncbi:Membrane protein involved in the export of O-antigen and teichoic acid [Lachnospiraceae bacterium]|nr:Membrane protein involved in the export of O-antigen and teichoic acid [Lachnospiraceae bacterium]
MENNSTKAVKSGFWYVISNVLIRSVGIITAPIYSKLLTTEETGYANSFLSYVSIITVVTCLCLIYSVGRAKLDFKDEFDEFMSSIQTLSSGFGLIVMILMMIICPAEGMMNFPRYVVIMLFAYLTIFPSIDYMQYKYRFEYRYKENIAISVFITISTVVLTVAFILLFPSDKGLMKILGTLVPSSAVAIWCYINILKSGKTLYKKKYWVYALKIGLPMIPHGLSLSILSRIDTTMVQNTCGFSDAGLYTSGYTIGTLLTFIIGAVGQAWLPWFNEQMYAENRDAIREKNKILMFYGCVLTIFFIAAAPEAVKILFMFNRTYWDSMWVVPPVALGTLCQYFYTNYVNLELYTKKTALIAGNSVIAAIINIGLNAYYIPRYGYIAAAYTTLAGYFILMIMHYLCTRFILKEKVYADGLYFIMVIVTSAVGIELSVLYPNWILRYVLLTAVALILAIIKKNDIIMAIYFVRRKFFKS